jgi:hypothetical protein
VQPTALSAQLQLVVLQCIRCSATYRVLYRLVGSVKALKRQVPHPARPPSESPAVRAECDNNMGVEVSWRDIKKLLPAKCNLSQFLGALCHYIRTYLGEEHMQRILDIGGNGNAFIHAPIPTKDMWDGVQSAHIKTLSCCFVIESSSKRGNVPIIFREIMQEVMESRPVTMPLHLRMAAWHDDQMRSGSGTRLDIGEIKTVLVPRQALLHRLDPCGELTVPSVRTRLEPLVLQLPASTTSSSCMMR